jgi:hypothetical protein
MSAIAASKPAVAQGISMLNRKDPQSANELFLGTEMQAADPDGNVLHNR